MSSHLGFHPVDSKVAISFLVISQILYPVHSSSIQTGCILLNPVWLQFVVCISILDSSKQEQVVSADIHTPSIVSRKWMQ